MITIGVLTISDSVSKGEREDLSGAAIHSLVAQLSDAIVVSRQLFPTSKIKSQHYCIMER